MTPACDPSKKLWIFDYDDTLAPNLHDYSAPILKFVEYCIAAFGHYAPHVPFIVAAEDRIDHEHVSAIDPETGNPFGYTARRFPSSMISAFEFLAGEVSRRSGEPYVVTETQRQELWDIGMLAFDEERYRAQGLLRGAEETLDFLVANGDDLRLVSKGEPWVQLRKFAATDMARWFKEHLYVVPSKSAAVLLEHSSGYDLARVWHVGNSKASDVFPAAEAGVGAVHIPLPTWTADNTREHEEVQYDRYVQCKRLTDIIRLYDTLTSQPQQQPF